MLPSPAQSPVLLPKSRPPALQTGPDSFILLLSAAIGVGTGLTIVLFRYLIRGIHYLAFEQAMGWIIAWGPWTLACVPILGGLLVGVVRIVRPAGQSLHPVQTLLGAALSLGSGASLGPEGPSVELGGRWGNWLARQLRVSQERQQVLQAAGVAAGLAAGFNAPISGAFLAFELLLGATFTGGAIPMILLAAVIAALIAQVGLGSQPAFGLPPYEMRSAWELPLYMGLGLVACVISLGFTAAVQRAEKLADFLPRRFVLLFPALGGVVIGLVALRWPQALGVGYETIEAMLQDVHFPLPLLVTLLLVKLGLTVTCLGTGWMGGIFAPAMFLGATLGLAYGKLTALLLGTWIPIAAPPAYAMVGMAAFLAACVRTPLTAILLLFELTRNSWIILPLMAAVGISIWLAEFLQPQGGWSPLAHLQAPQSTASLDALTVKDVMGPVPPQVDEAQSLEAVARYMTQHHLGQVLITNAAGRLVGILTPQDLNRWLAEPQELPWSHIPVSRVCTSDVLTAYDDENLAQVMKHMYSRGLHQLPVLSHTTHSQVIGLLRWEDIDLARKLAQARLVLNNGRPANPLIQPLALSNTLVSE